MQRTLVGEVGEIRMMNFKTSTVGLWGGVVLIGLNNPHICKMET